MADWPAAPTDFLSHGIGEGVLVGNGGCSSAANAGDDSATRDHYHGSEFAAELRHEVVDQAIDFFPGDEFASMLRWLHGI